MKHARSDYDRIQDPSGKIPDDEPVFLLRGQDVASPSVVRYWANRNRALGGSAELSRLAEDHAHTMEIWQHEQTMKVADGPHPPIEIDGQTGEGTIRRGEGTSFPDLAQGVLIEAINVMMMNALSFNPNVLDQYISDPKTHPMSKDIGYVVKQFREELIQIRERDRNGGYEKRSD